MTEREQNIVILAQKIMGWRQRKTDMDYVDFWRPDKSNITTWPGAPGGDGLSWNPYSSIADAWMLIDALRKRGLWFKIVTPWGADDLEYSAGFTEFGMVDNGSSWVRGRGQTACEAICAAALKVIEAQP